MKNSYLIALVLVAALCAAVFGYYKFIKPAKVAKVDATTASEFPTTPRTADDIPGARTSSLDPAGPGAASSTDDPFAAPGTPTGAPRIAMGGTATTTTQPSNQSLPPLPGASNLGPPSAVKMTIGPTTQPSAQSGDPFVGSPGKVAAAAPKPAGTYTIKAGDVLSVVSKEQLGSAKLWRKIVAANPGLDPDHLKVGQVIALPQIASKTPAAIPLRMPLPSPDHLTSSAARQDNTVIIPAVDPISPRSVHIVTTGETLYSIAREVYPHGGGDWNTIYAANRKAIGDKPSGLRIGMKLIIPAL